MHFFRKVKIYFTHSLAEVDRNLDGTKDSIFLLRSLKKIQESVNFYHEKKILNKRFYETSIQFAQRTSFSSSVFHELFYFFMYSIL
jgi:hypothetical protein